MADNVEADAGSGGAIFASDDIGGVQYPRAKVVWGVDGAAVDASATNPLPVVQTGTHTVDLGATDNAVLDSAVALLTTIDADTSNLSVVGGGTEAAAIRVTIANNSTGVLSVDDNGGALTVDGTVTANLSATDNAVLDAIAASTAAIETAVEGTLTVGSHAVTNAGTFAVQVDGAALTALQLIDNLVLAEDAVHSTGAPGILPLVVRQDSQSDLAADGDYVPMTVDADGGLRVSIVAGAGSGGTSAADDADFTDGTTSGTPIMGVYEGTPTTVTDGDLGVVRIDADRNLVVAAVAGDAQFLDDAAFTLTSDAVIMVGAIRDDSLSTLSAAEGDAVPFRVSSTGALHVTGGGGGTEYTEDVATANPIVGTATMMERDDALSALTPIEGDWAAMRCDANGALWVAATDGGGTLTVDGTVTANLSATDNAVLDAIAASVAGTLTVGSHAVTNAGTFATQVDGAALTALQLIDNVVHVDDAAFTLGTSSGVMMMGFAGTQSVNANDAAALACETDGSLHIHDGGNTITVDGTVTANLSATDNAVLDNIDADLTTIIGHVDGIETLLGTIDADTGSIMTAVQLIDNTIIAHDASAASASVNMMGLEARSTDQTAVASADAVKATATLTGKQVVLPFAISQLTWQYASPAAVTDTADDAAKAAAGAGIINYITGVQVFNGHDTVGTEVVIKDGSTVIWRGWAEQTGGGCSASFNPPLKGTANTAVNVANITTGSATYFNLQGYTSVDA